MPLTHLTETMGYTLVVWYEGTVNGKPAVSLDTEVGVNFYSAEEAIKFAPKFHKEKLFNGTPTYDMKDDQGGVTLIDILLPYLAQVGDKLYCTVVTKQFSGHPAFYSVADGYALTPDDIRKGALSLPVDSGWLSRQPPLYQSMTNQCAYITSGLPAEPPAPVDRPDEETRLPSNALQIQYRRTVAFIGVQDLELHAPQLRQSVELDDQWWLNPTNTEDGGDVYACMTTSKDDQVCFYVNRPGSGKKPLGCVTIEADGQLASVELPACTVACFFDKQMTLSYTVDFGEGVHPSPSKVINVLTPEFERPLIEEANPDRLLCLDNFSGDANVIAPLGAYSQCASRCWMWITGKHADGSDYRFDILAGAVVTDDWKKDGVRADIPRAELEKIGDCSEFELRVMTSFCEASELKDALKFPPETFTIYQKPLTPRAPTVKEAQGGVLVPWNAREAAHIYADYDGFQPSHQHTAQWCLDGEDTCWPLPLQKSTSGPITFLASREQAILSFRKKALITYTVINACKQMESETLELQVGEPLMHRRPRPVVKEATGNTLDLRTLPGKYAQIIVKSTDPDVDLAWWFFMVGHFAVLTIQQELGENSSITIPVMARPLEIGDKDGLSCLILRSELEKLESHKQITINFSQFIGTHALGSVEIKFQQSTLTLIKALNDFTDFNPDGKDWNGWEKGKGATDSRDLRRKAGLIPGGLTGWFLEDWGYTNTTDPSTQREKLFKVFNNLDVGRSYIFSAWVRDVVGNVRGKPGLVLVVEGKDITPIAYPEGTAWHLLEGEFVASSSTMRLALHNAVMGINPANDFEVTHLTVKENS
ncbi:hypothetical protein C4J95_3682 [Pseudomonas orientalis]|uniref:hypothetical protein n=1 Tax=Pseudomonas orientalis TaxID=76758 RepID=UPI000F565A00|nr:hypothetical protein [Pseudomonas orientalis]AZF01127.1 hypothetical protein C4J95_3682 [Pseudomonas orientalis]